MTLTVNHEYADEIMMYLYDMYGVIGDEEHLKDELISDFVDVLRLENYLSNEHNYTVDLPKDLRFIEIK